MSTRTGLAASTVAIPADAKGARDALRGAALVLLTFVAYAGLCAGFWRAGTRGPDAFVVVPQAIDAARTPEWLPQAEVARINSLGAAVKGRSLLDPDLASDLAACYLESPWVAQVLHIRRAYPNRLDVELAIRRPVAVVARANGPAVVLDRTGVRLPVSAVPDGLARISGVGSTPPPPGHQWQDVRIADGLRVLERYGALFSRTEAPLAKAKELFAPREIRVGSWSRPSGRPSVEILTASGLVIVWGVDLPSGEGTVTGPPAEEKLATLAEILPRIARDGRLPASVLVCERAGPVIAGQMPGPNPQGAR